MFNNFTIGTHLKAVSEGETVKAVSESLKAQGAQDNAVAEAVSESTKDWLGGLDDTVCEPQAVPEALMQFAEALMGGDALEP